MQGAYGRTDEAQGNSKTKKLLRVAKTHLLKPQKLYRIGKLKISNSNKQINIGQLNIRSQRFLC